MLNLNKKKIFILSTMQKNNCGAESRTKTKKARILTKMAGEKVLRKKN